MGISSALSNAFSGLTAASRAADLISNNLANSMTEDYSRRELGLSSVTLNGFGSGVRVTGVDRATDKIATASRRDAASARSDATARMAAAERMATVIGDPSKPASLSEKFVRFENAITASANDPANAIALDNAVGRAGDVADHLNKVSAKLSEIRTDTDREIFNTVTTLNTSLTEIRDLNVQIRHRTNTGGDVNGLLDQRKQVIDRVAEIIPVTVVDREFEQVSLFTPAGGVLIDSSNAVTDFGFSATPLVDHTMTLGAPLSGLTAKGTPVSIGGGSGFFDGGSLGALFDIRDTDVPATQAKMDALARDLVERFEDPAVDTSLVAGDAGLFTDAGSAFLPANELGLSRRIEINAVVDSNAGGSSWRLRDGMNAAVQGDAGANGILKNMEAALVAQRTPSASLGVPSAMGAGGFFGFVTAQAAQDYARLEETAEFAETDFAVMREIESSQTGVDSDEQLQKLLEIENIYAANAQVMRAIDSMFDELMRLGR